MTNNKAQILFPRIHGPDHDLCIRSMGSVELLRNHSLFKGHKKCFKAVLPLVLSNISSLLAILLSVLTSAAG